MFFQTPEITADILSVIELEWEHINANSGSRPFHALSIRLKGGATFFLDGKETLRVEEGDITFAPAYLDFRKQAEEGKILAIHFTAKEELPHEMLRFQPQDPQEFIENFKALHQAWSRKQLGYEHQSKMILHKIFYEMEQEWAEKKPSTLHGRLTEISNYIHRHFTDEDLSVERLASRFGMSDTYFRKLFLGEFGTTPLKYVNALRLDYAKELLRSGYYTIEEIAERCGFNNINYFSFFIKKETGLAPMALRRELLEKMK